MRSGGRKVEIPFATVVRDRNPLATRVLVADTPFEAFSTSEGALFAGDGLQSLCEERHGHVRPIFLGYDEPWLLSTVQPVRSELCVNGTQRRRYRRHHRRRKRRTRGNRGGLVAVTLRRDGHLAERESDCLAAQ